MQQTLTSCLPGTGTESSVQSSKSQRPQKQYGSDSVLEADVPEKREKVSEGKIPFGGVSHSQPTDCQRFLETNATITKNGGVIEIPNTGVVLMIPPDALPGCMKHLKIHMRITPRGEIIERETSFSSNSSTVVQLFPCSLKFLRPVRLTLPHCLVLQGTGERKARIFTSRHKKGSGPEWEERTHLSYHLEDTACIILLDSLCWVKFSIDDEIVKAKKLTVYTALRKLQPQDEFAEVHIGYYVDLPEQKKVIEDNRDLIIKQRKSFNFIKTKEKYSLRISLENIYPNEQQFQALQPYLREITHRHIELFVNYSLLYHIGRKPSQAITPLCVFHVSQVDRKEAVQLTIHVKICSDEHNSQVAQSFPLDDYQECYISRKAISTKVGGMLEISNTGIVLGIPPNALPEDKESYEIQMRYIPKRTLKDQGEYSPSYSTAVVEILPNLKLQYPVSLSLPHCLVLQQNIERKARIFGSHHDKGAHPFWEEQKDVSYHVEDTHCILLLNKFSWYTYLIDDEVVKAKKMVVYAAAQKFQSCDDVVRIEIGCYPDLPVRDKEIHRGQNLHIAHTKTLYFVKREEQYPLRISLNDIFPSEWRCRCCCRFPDTHTQEISYRNIWVGLGGSCVYILERTGRTLVWPLCVFTASQEKGYTAVQLAVNFQVMGKVSSTTGSKDNQSESLLKAETIITKAGGELKIEGTGVVLKISPNALKGNNENQLVQMRIIPSRLIEDQVTPFSSNSCTAVEIFPNNIRLRKPAELRLPHCLMLNKIRDRAARILINYQKGSPAIWEEDKNVPHTLDESACMIKLKTFCCVKYYIDDTSVMGKKIRVYTAAREVEENDEVAEVEIGYCPDIPGVGELLRMNPSFTVDSVEKLLFLEKIKSPLQLSLEDISSSQWTCWFPKDKPWDIPFEVVASSIEHSHLFILQKTNEGVGSVICRFTAVQKEGEMAIMLALTVRPKVTQDFDGRATGHAFQEHRKKLKADSGNLTIKLLSRKLREEWKDVCRKLGVEEGKLYREEADNKGNLKEAIYQCLLSWKEDKGDKATFESLRVALVENERSDLAEDITKYEELF
ncbi:Netrin receptor UNC5D [Holothuria leucospilota]|uniref:Netrin receptor UNC5 n=1 Tax=Holothuria leucospilota TaxID=206669 RepID=A0A9Q1C6E5_HOLLE|nr:Netrin receptor UNC5D [Holothuria leucospilota]